MTSASRNGTVCGSSRLPLGLQRKEIGDVVKHDLDDILEDGLKLIFATALYRHSGAPLPALLLLYPVVNNAADGLAGLVERSALFQWLTKGKDRPLPPRRRRMDARALVIHEVGDVVEDVTKVACTSPQFLYKVQQTCTTASLCNCLTDVPPVQLYYGMPLMPSTVYFAATEGYAFLSLYKTCAVYADTYERRVRETLDDWLDEVLDDDD